MLVKYTVFLNTGRHHLKVQGHREEGMILPQTILSIETVEPGTDPLVAHTTEKRGHTIMTGGHVIMTGSHMIATGHVIVTGGHMTAVTKEETAHPRQTREKDDTGLSLRSQGNVRI